MKQRHNYKIKPFNQSKKTTTLLGYCYRVGGLLNLLSISYSDELDFILCLVEQRSNSTRVHRFHTPFSGTMLKLHLHKCYMFSCCVQRNNNATALASTLMSTVFILCLVWGYNIDTTTDCFHTVCRGTITKLYVLTVSLRNNNATTYMCIYTRNRTRVDCFHIRTYVDCFQLFLYCV